MTTLRHRSTPSFLNTHLIIGALLLFIAVVILAFGIFVYNRSLAFQAKGVEVTGIITDHTSSTDSDNNTKYFIDYNYKDKAEHKYSGAGEVKESLWNTEQDGAKIGITYIKDNPSISKFSTADSQYFQGLTATLLGGIGTLVCMVSLIHGIRLGLLRLHLLAKGQAISAVATHVSVIESKDDDGKVTKVYALQYEYAEGGTLFLGDIRLEEELATEWIKNLANGMNKLEIVFDPAQPAKHVAIITDEDRHALMSRPLR